MTKKNVLILGAGAFGQAIAASTQDKKVSVTLLARNDIHFESCKQYPSLKHCNYKTFDQFKGEEFDTYDLMILAIPCQSLREVCQWIQSFKNRKRPLYILSTAKGIESSSLSLPHQIIQQTIDNVYIGALSGPSFAKEMLEGKPTCVVVASKSKDLLNRSIECLHSSRLRIYDSQDVIGVEVAGALKNVIALVAGGVDGLGLGHNSRAAVITRGLSEITRLGLQLGADPLTFMGLSGLGDLILTCTGELSRNRQVGFRLAQGESQNKIVQSIGGVVEGIATAKSAYALIQNLKLDLAILTQAYLVLYEQMPVADAVKTLISRDQGKEIK